LRPSFNNFLEEESPDQPSTSSRKNEAYAPKKEVSKFMGEITFGGKAENEYNDFM